MTERHTAEDLAFLREKGFVATAAEIERLHAVEDATMGAKCPRCGQEMEWQSADDDVGITEGWVCDCGHAEDDPDHYADEADLEPHS